METYVAGVEAYFAAGHVVEVFEDALVDIVVAVGGEQILLHLKQKEEKCLICLLVLKSYLRHQQLDPQYESMIHFRVQFHHQKNILLKLVICLLLEIF